MAEPTPGRPGGASAGPRSATAATFVVNDSSLQNLHTTWRKLIADVKEFNTELQNLNSKGGKAVDQLAARLGHLGVGGGGRGGAVGGTIATAGGRMAGMPPVPVHLGSTIPVGSPNYHGPQPGQGGVPNVTSAGGGGGGTPPLAGGASPWKRVAQAAAVGVGAVGMFYQNRMGDISDSDLFFNQQAQNTGYGYRGAEKSGARNAMFGRPGGRGPGGGVTGYQSVQDLLGGAQTVFGATGGTTGGRGMAQLRAAGQLSSLTPNAGLAGSSQAVASLYDPTMSARLTSIGAGPSVGLHGQLQSPQQIYQRVVATVFRGQRPTARMITEGLQPGAPLYVTLTQGLGLGPDAVEQFSRYAIAAANLGGNYAQADRATTLASRMQTGGKVSKSERALVKTAGLDDSIRAHQNRAGAAGARQTIEAGREAEGALMKGFDALAGATDILTNSFKRLNDVTGGASGNALGGAGMLGGPIQSGLNAIGGIGGGMFMMQALRGMRGGAGGGGGLLGRLGGGLRGVGGLRGAGGLLGRLGMGAGAAGEGAGLVGAAAAAAPLALAGAAGGILGHDVNLLTHAGAFGFLGAKGDIALQEEEARNQSHALIDVIHKLTTEGYMKIPAAKAMWQAEVKPLVEQSIRAKGADKDTAELRAIQAVGRLKKRFRSQLNNFALGGVVPGNHNRDDVDIKATPGEVVVPKNIVNRHGGASALMQRLGFLGRGRNGHYAGGGEVTGDTKGLNADFLKRLTAWSAYVGQPFVVGSGYRSLDEQKVLYDRWMRRVPGQAVAAKPGSSNHNYGLAADGPHWASKNPGKFGLTYPMSFEPWHVEPIGAKSMRGGGAGAAYDGSASDGADLGRSSGGTGGGNTGNVAAAPGVMASEKSAMAAFLAKANSPYGVTDVPSGAQQPGKASSADAAPAAASVPAAPENSSGNVQLGRQRAAARGWTGTEWDALYQLWNKESGWRTDAANGSSSARGIAQTMMSVHFGKNWQKDKRAQSFMHDPMQQIEWGLNYISQRYSKPSAAWAHSQKMNWYEQGSWQTDDEVARLHKDEMVVPARYANKMRDAVRNRGSVVQSAAASGGGGHGPIQVTISMPVTLAGQATQQDARHLLSMVKTELEQDETLALLGGV